MNMLQARIPANISEMLDLPTTNNCKYTYFDNICINNTKDQVKK